MIKSSKGRPPFRADHVGSLLRPPVLRQAFKDYFAKRIDDIHFAQIQDQCIRDVVKLQEDVGLEVVTDGEFRRGSYWSRFVERIDGFVIKPAVFKFRVTTAMKWNSPHPMRLPNFAGHNLWRSTNLASCAA